MPCYPDPGKCLAIHVAFNPPSFRGTCQMSYYSWSLSNVPIWGAGACQMPCNMWSLSTKDPTARGVCQAIILQHKPWNLSSVLSPWEPVKVSYYLWSLSRKWRTTRRVCPELRMSQKCRQIVVEADQWVQLCSVAGPSSIHLHVNMYLQWMAIILYSHAWATIVMHNYTSSSVKILH
jgi:hypothetical protein